MSRDKAKKVFDEATKSLTSREQSALERAKILDKDFRMEIEGVEKAYGEQVASYLDITVSSLMDRMTRGEERITISETVQIANTLRKLIKDQIEIKGRDIVIGGSECPKQGPCTKCPKCAETAALSDNDLDKRIRHLKRHLDYQALSKSPDH